MMLRLVLRIILIIIALMMFKTIILDNLNSFDMPLVSSFINPQIGDALVSFGTWLVSFASNHPVVTISALIMFALSRLT